jgi:7-alpha-hydroxysteroid dehydrogenase
MFDPAKFRLDGQVALVTGAGAGIGRGIAEMFAGAGASVVVSDLKKETADEVAKGITEAGGKAVGLACNVTKEEDLQAAVQAAIDNFGSLSILVNNAGGGGPSPSTCRWTISAGPTSSTSSRRSGSPSSPYPTWRRPAAARC